MAIYTPGSSAGLPLSVLRSFAAPPPAVLDDPDALRERIASAVSGLLALVGVEADPIQSREHILLAQLFAAAWGQRQDLDLPALIRAIQSPPFDKVGLVDLETFFPAKDRFALAMLINNLLASPSFAGWLEGEPLDIQRLLYTPQSKPRLSILSIAHLSDAERMFFVTLLLGELLAWVRSQPGTSSLRALFYMDEVFGYFPPSANPPSKKPMLTLLKQARAFGLGIVLATQNPVDLDYKGLSNAGTWLLGRLQTERDKARVLEGLEGASVAASASFDRQAMESTLAALGNRVFLMNNVHEAQPVVFQSRWCLSYLRGPLARPQIQSLMASRRQAAPASSAASGPPASLPAIAPSEGQSPTSLGAARPAQRPMLPPEAGECFLALSAPLGPNSRLLYRPALLGRAKAHYLDAKRGVDHWQDYALLVPLADDVPADAWADAQPIDESSLDLAREPEDAAQFAPAPASLGRANLYARWQKDLQSHLYRAVPAAVRLPGTARVLAARRDAVRIPPPPPNPCPRGPRRGRRKPPQTLRAQVQDPRRPDSAAPKTASRARSPNPSSKPSRRSSRPALRSSAQFLGRKVVSKGTVSSAASAMRSASRAAQQRQDVDRVEDSLTVVQQRLADLEAEFQTESQRLETELNPAQLPVEEVSLQPKKSEILVQSVVAVWNPPLSRPPGARRPRLVTAARPPFPLAASC